MFIKWNTGGLYLNHILLYLPPQVSLTEPVI